MEMFKNVVAQFIGLAPSVIARSPDESERRSNPGGVGEGRLLRFARNDKMLK